MTTRRPRNGAPDVVVGRSGTPRRVFRHVDDRAAAACCLMARYVGEAIVNVGTGTDLSLGELAALVQRIVGYAGSLRFDPVRPDGAPRKLLDADRLTRLPWRATTDTEAGIESTYRWYRENEAAACVIELRRLTRAAGVFG